MRLSKIISFALAIAVTGSASAAGIGVRAGTNGVGADIGVIFQGSPKSTLTATCSPTASAAQCTQLPNSVAAQQASLDDTISKYKYYPVASIGITIGF